MARKERQGQNRLPGFILYDHHQGRIVVPALFSQRPDCALGMRKCRCNIRQVRTMRIILDPVLSAYCEEISRHQTPPRLRPVSTSSSVISLNDGRQGIDVDQSRALHQRRSNSGSLAILVTRLGLSNSGVLQANPPIFSPRPPRLAALSFSRPSEIRGRSAHTLLGCNHVDLKFRVKNRSNESLSGLTLGLASVSMKNDVCPVIGFGQRRPRSLPENVHAGG